MPEVGVPTQRDNDDRIWTGEPMSGEQAADIVSTVMHRRGPVAELRDKGNRFLRRHSGPLSDLGAIALALLDVLLVFPKDAELYSHILSGVACLALVLRRRYPFLVLLATVPGYLAGWSQLAGMIALYSLAKKRAWNWQTMAGAVLMMLCRFVVWPIDDFLGQDWQHQLLNLLWSVVDAGMPLALGLLVTTRKELVRRVTELAATRERKQQLQAQAIRAEERTRLAREMHDVVSHQVTLIAMQAGALKMTVTDPDSREIANTIRRLSTKTLEELRQLVGVLRTTSDEDDGRPDLTDLRRLVSDCGLAVTLNVDGDIETIPRPVSAAAYRTVQEALTNVGKHAPSAAVSVLVQVGEDELEVRVRNGRPRGQRTPALPSGGHGLVGLTERAELLGGSCHAEPSRDGGFVVTSRFPLALPGVPAPQAPQHA
ncbi:sensor histidine kinase [Kutzneria kofuensis]|uniref:histidine kinase n=2 Tax=Kutzneria kofuensis TaxID=103725 RepID=A0A7W9KBM4_9PSEU|nr:sensor histidine kinase [Kutzneria kofuensis]MBB5889542.1 signal transduction histidine kinase [Kutzneria kofuensis]